MQGNLSIVGDDISADLKYLASYDPFDVSLGHNFLALHIAGASGSIVSACCVPTQGMGWQSAASNADDFVFQVTEGTKQVKVRATKDGATQERTYDLKLTLAGE